MKNSGQKKVILLNQKLKTQIILKIIFNSDDNFHLVKTQGLYNILIAVRAIFMKTTNITVRFSQMNVRISCKCYSMIELTFLKELILINSKF